MTIELNNKIFNYFNRSYRENVYLRKEEKEKIKRFINSSNQILHICGKPGTGKTLTVKHLLKEEKYIYLNAYSDIKEILLSKTKPLSKIIVIDEFDILEKNYKKETEQIIKLILNSKSKLITISNYLGFTENVLFFKPYSPEEIEEIILLKFKNELKDELLTPVKIKLIAKKSTDGDLRNTFDRVINELTASPNPILHEESDIHKEIVKEIINKTKKKDKNDLYEIYLKKCKEIKIKAYERSDFILLCDFFN